MKLGILGTGKIVQEFLPWLVEHTPFTVQAVCSTPRSAAKAAELCAQYQIPQHTTNYFELLQWVDVVYIAVPNLQHARYARVALEAGKHVIVEKPMAVTAAETEELAALAQRKQLFLFEALNSGSCCPGWAQCAWYSAASASIPAGTMPFATGRPRRCSTRCVRAAH